MNASGETLTLDQGPNFNGSVVEALKGLVRRVKTINPMHTPRGDLFFVEMHCQKTVVSGRKAGQLSIELVP